MGAPCSQPACPAKRLCSSPVCALDVDDVPGDLLCVVMLTALVHSLSLEDGQVCLSSVWPSCLPWPWPPHLCCHRVHALACPCSTAFHRPDAHPAVPGSLGPGLRGPPKGLAWFHGSLRSCCGEGRGGRGWSEGWYLAGAAGHLERAHKFGRRLPCFVIFINPLRTGFCWELYFEVSWMPTLSLFSHDVGMSAPQFSGLG